jgi:hypothetical protein
MRLAKMNGIAMSFSKLKLTGVRMGKEGDTGLIFCRINKDQLLRSAYDSDRRHNFLNTGNSKMTNRFLVPLMLAALFAATGLIPANSVVAQSNLADEDRATVLFDLRLGKMRDGEFMQSMESEIEELQGGMVEETGFDPNNVVRIFGAASLPDNMEEFGGAEPPKSFQFFVRMEMVDASSAEEFMASLGDAEEVEMGGTTYKSPEDGLLFHLAEESTVEIGTEKFLSQATRRLFTEGLGEAFKKTPDFGIRIVADLDAESDMIAEVMAMAKADAPPMMAPMLDMVDNAKDLSISIDFDADNMISIAATGNNESDADELRGGLDGLLGMAKMFGSDTSGIPDPEVAKMAKEVVESLKATRDGLNVRIDIPRPSNFDAGIKSVVQMIPQMLMGGF